MNACSVLNVRSQDVQRASNGRQDLVFPLPISFAQSLDRETSWWEVGMSITVAIGVAALLYIVTVTFVGLVQELKRDLPRQE